MYLWIQWTQLSPWPDTGDDCNDTNQRNCGTPGEKMFPWRFLQTVTVLSWCCHSNSSVVFWWISAEIAGKSSYQQKNVDDNLFFNYLLTSWKNSAERIQRGRHGRALISVRFLSFPYSFRTKLCHIIGMTGGVHPWCWCSNLVNPGSVTAHVTEKNIIDSIEDFEKLGGRAKLRNAIFRQGNDTWNWGHLKINVWG